MTVSHAALPLTAAGIWYWRWETTAPHGGAAEGALYVNPSKI